MGNVRTVREMYEAFGRGDVPAILSRLPESAEWDYNMPAATAVPWLRPRRGQDGAAAFFASLAGIEIRRFAPKEFLEGDGVVVALLDVEFSGTCRGWSGRGRWRSAGPGAGR